jgi:hypothetical protein
MKCSKRLFAVVPVVFALLLPPSVATVYANDADHASYALAAVKGAKQKCVNTCRARYRECRAMKQLTSFECQNVYQDCARWTCNGMVD